VPASITWEFCPPQWYLHCLRVPWGRKEIKPQQANITVEKAGSAFPENTIWNIFYFEWLTSRPKLSKGSLKTGFFTIAYTVQKPQKTPKTDLRTQLH